MQINSDTRTDHGSDTGSSEEVLWGESWTGSQIGGFDSSQLIPCAQLTINVDIWIGDPGKDQSLRQKGSDPCEWLAYSAPPVTTLSLPSHFSS